MLPVDKAERAGCLVKKLKCRAADLLEVVVRLGLGLGVLRYQVRSRLSAWLRPMSASVVVMCLMISSSASLHPKYHL